MHQLLERQLKKYLKEIQNPPAGWQDFLEAINRVYEGNDEDRKLIERSLELSSKELGEKNQKLKKEEIKLKKAQQMALIGNWEYDPAANKFELSEEIYQIIKADPNTLDKNYNNLLQFVHPDDRAKVSEAIQQSIKSMQPFSIEYKVVDSQGQIHFVHSAGEVISKEGQTSKVFGVVQDITVQKNNELQIKRSQQFLDNIINALADPLLVINDKHQFVEVNLAFCNMTRRTRNQLIGRTPHDLLPPEQANTLIKKEDAIFQSMQKTIFEDTLTESSGFKRTIINTTSPYIEPLTGEKMLVEVITDITSQKQAQEEARNLAAIIQSTNDAVIARDQTGKITSWNKGAESLFGFSAQEMIGTMGDNFIPEEYRHEMKEILDRVSTGQSISHSESRRRRKDGIIIDVSFTISPVRDASGNIIGSSAIAQDISERKRSESKLRERTEDLEKLNNLMVGRELKMVELKQEIAKLRGQLGQNSSSNISVDNNNQAP